MSKYTDHIPLHRLMVMLRRQHGIEIPRNTMVSWVEQSAALLIAVYRAMQAKLRKKGYLQVDETPVRYLQQGARGQSKRSYIWVYLTPAGEVIFQWSTGGAAAAPEAFLGPEFHGTLQCDGYSAYTALSDGRLEIDTNLVENAIRPCALGGRNWLFIGHEDAGERAALFYTLMASCRLHGINPMEYLRDVLTRLPSAMNTEIDPFTPEAWARARRNSAC